MGPEASLTGAEKHPWASVFTQQVAGGMAQDRQDTPGCRRQWGHLFTVSDALFFPVHRGQWTEAPHFNVGVPIRPHLLHLLSKRTVRTALSQPWCLEAWCARDLICGLPKVRARASTPHALWGAAQSQPGIRDPGAVLAAVLCAVRRTFRKKIEIKIKLEHRTVLVCSVLVTSTWVDAGNLSERWRAPCQLSIWVPSRNLPSAYLPG